MNTQKPTQRNVPRRIFFTRGKGVHREKLASFESALRDAGIADLNLVYVSSIFPPGCRKVSVDSGLASLSPGEITHCVMARQETNERGRRIVASIGVAIPRDPELYGYLSEHHGYGETHEQASDYAEDLAASMLATTLGIPFDPDKDYNERKEQYRMGGQIVKTQSFTQTAGGAPDGVWTTVISCAVLLPD
jgi:arginine decarboxylase